MQKKMKFQTEKAGVEKSVAISDSLKLKCVMLRQIAVQGKYN